jgi:hypothetical protein
MGFIKMGNFLFFCTKGNKGNFSTLNKFNRTRTEPEPGSIQHEYNLIILKCCTYKLYYVK